MKKITRYFIACMAAVLLIFSSGVTAFADESVQAVQSDETAEIAESYIRGLVEDLAASTPEQIEEYITMYSAYGYEDTAQGLSQWNELSGSVGELKEISNAAYAESTDGMILFTADLKFANADVSMTFTLDAYTNQIAGISFVKTGNEKASTGLGATLKDAAVNLVVGMGTVFAVLIFLCGVIYLFKFISKAEKSIADKKTGKKRQEESVTENRPAVAVTPAPASDEELKAVIAAAIAAYEADNGSAVVKQPGLKNGINIKSYRRN